MEEGFLPDARTGRRFPLTLPVKIKGGNSRRSQAATTNNLSAASVFISTDLPFRKGSKLNFQITLPAPVIGSKTRCGSQVHRARDTRGHAVARKTARRGLRDRSLPIRAAAQAAGGQVNA